MDRRADLIRRIKDHLAIYAVRVDMDKGEASKAAEDFYCDLLNILLGYQLENMNRKEKNYPAIDLGENSENRKLGVQVTSTTTRQKVQDTLDTFFRHHLEDTYTHLTMLVIGKWTESRKSFRMDGTLDFDPNRDIWDTDWLLAQIEAIQDIDHLKRIMTHLEQHLELVQLPPAPLDLPLRTAMNENNFVGREAELAEIAERFKTERIVVLSGLGGMGKTELAVRFGRDYAIPGVRRAYFVRYSGSFAQTIRENVAPKVEGLTTEGKTDQQIYTEAIAALKKCGRDDLLILDNADQEANLTELRYALSELPMRVLITTRARSKGAMPLRAIDREKLHLIFDRHTENVTVAQMDMLIDTVKGHTMTVDLIARTLGDPMAGVTPEEIRSAMTGSRVSEEDYPEVDTDYERDMQQRQIYAHLTALFQLRDITPAERQALCCATLLPVDGMETKLFMDALPAEAKTAARSLEKRGWIQCENKLVAIHPVVRMVCRRKLEPTEADCGEFLESQWNSCDYSEYNKVKYLQLAELFSLASKDMEDRNGNWALSAGVLWNRLGEAQKALEHDLLAVTKREQTQPNSVELAKAYNNMGSTYNSLGNYEQALDYMQKALTIKEILLPPKHSSLMTSYDNLGGIYGAMGEHDNALKYALKALEIRESDFQTEPSSLAKSYNNVGMVYMDLGDYRRALAYLQKALEIYKEILPSNHPDLASVYNNIGGAYQKLGNSEQTLEYMEKALAIRLSVLPPEHPDVAISYSSVGVAYIEAGNYRRGLECQQKALSIQEKILPSDHLYNVFCCRNIAMTYAKMDDFTKAVEYAERASEKAERSMRGHPDLEEYRRLPQTLKLYMRMRELGMNPPNPFK